MVFAEAEFRRTRKAADGASDGEHADLALAIWAKLGKSIPKPAGGERAPDCPFALIYLWEWFGDIFSGCAANGFTPRMIGWRDLADWCALTGNVLEPWEARALLALSNKRIEIVSEKKPGS
jgi:hypothetical protein